VLFRSAYLASLAGTDWFFPFRLAMTGPFVVFFKNAQRLTPAANNINYKHMSQTPGWCLNLKSALAPGPSPPVVRVSMVAEGHRLQGAALEGLNVAATFVG
jgi:hypothetical protein